VCAQGECAQWVCSKKFCLNIDIIIDFFMIVSDFFEQSLILWPIPASFVWLKVGAMRCIKIKNLGFGVVFLSRKKFFFFFKNPKIPLIY